MKKLFIILLWLITINVFSQTPLKSIRVINATTQFGENFSEGTKVYDMATENLWIAIEGVVSTATLTTASSSFKLIAIGDGNVNASGTPADNQVAVWTDPTTIEGAANFVFTGSNVGIGTTDPGASLHVAHSGGSSSIFRRSFNGGIGGAVFSLEKSRGTVAIPLVLQIDDEIGNVRFRGYSGNKWVAATSIQSYCTHIDADTICASIEFQTRDTNNVKVARMYIDMYGNVGIGTTDPAYMLQVLGNIVGDTLYAKLNWNSVYNKPSIYTQTEVQNLVHDTADILRTEWRVDIHDSLVANSQGFLTSISETDPIFTAHMVAGITATDTSHWHTAYGWDDHASVDYQNDSDTTSWDATRYWVGQQGYLTSFSETDPVFTAHMVAGITATDTSHWHTAYGWDDHASVDYQNDSDTTSWDATRYWVGQQGYLTSFSETDPVFTAHMVAGITATDTSHWHTAYGWDDHASVDYQNDSDTTSWDATRYWVGQQGYLTSFSETDPVYSGDPASSITSAQINFWNTAYGWGNHASVDYQNDSDTTSWDATRYWVGQQGYLTSSSETDPVYSGDPASSITSAQINFWNTAYGWGNHASVDYQNDSDTTSWDATRYWVGQQGYLTSSSETDPIFTAHMVSGITATDTSHWHTAYGWGDHSIVGYLTTESDPIFTAHAAYGITGTNISNWNTAYGWGNHASVDYQNDSDTTSWDATRYWVGQQGYLTSFSETDPVYSGDPASGIVAGDITNWNTAHGWGDHSVAGYGNVSNTGTPAASEITIWTNTTTIKGVDGFEFNTVGTDSYLYLNAPNNTNKLYIFDNTVSKSNAIRLGRSGNEVLLVTAYGGFDIIHTLDTIGNGFYAGNIGIGTSQPGEKLEIKGSPPFYMNFDDGTYDNYIGVSSAGQIILKPGDRFLRVEGNVNAFSAVNGFTQIGNAGVSKYSINVSDDGSVSVMHVDTLGAAYFAGNVGIGDNTPTYKLDVDGTSRITGNAQFDSKIDINGSIALPVTFTDANLTLTDSHHFIVVDDTDRDVTITLPDASDFANRQYIIKCINGTNTVYVVRSGSDNIYTNTTVTSVTLAAAGNTLMVQSDGISVWYGIGGGTW